MKLISFIQPSRSNLKYLKWSYESIRKNLNPEHEICWADDASTDGTWEWMQEIAEKDPYVKIHRNDGPERLGHTILYDTLVNDYATNDIVMIYHADMYACPNMDKEVLKHLEPGVVVSATRIEPPLHPDGPEKILMDYGIEPEEFKESELVAWLSSSPELHNSKLGKETTNGIFAPWAIYKSDFQSVGGHDPLFAPQSKEDSDIFNRFVLNGYKLIQSWRGFVYHMTCRGSRFKDATPERNPGGQVFLKNRESDEWLKQNHRSTRNFIRKWGSMVKHDTMMKPIIPPKYDIGFVVKNCNYDLLYELEPWCSKIYIESHLPIVDYISNEQKNTSYNLQPRVWYIPDNLDKQLKIMLMNDIIVEFDASRFTNDKFQFLTQLPEILRDSGEVGEMEHDIFKLTINKLKTYEEDLILCRK